MPAFQYFAVDAAGRHVRGRMDASNENDLEQRLRRMGLDLVVSRQRSSTPLFTLAKRISRQDLINFCFHLEQIARSGIPMLEGLADLAESTEHKRFREVVSALHEDMEGGRLLSEAMAQHPGVFGPLFTSVIRTGEQTGNLQEVLHDLATTLRWQDELVNKTRLLLLYPSMVFVVVTAVIFFLMLYLVPKLVDFISAMGQTLPLQTRILIGASRVFTDYWALLIALPLFSLVAAVLAVHNNANARLYWDYLKLNLPLIGPALQQLMMARFANYLAMLYRSGITILDALAACEGVVDNRYVARGLQRAAQQVSAGESLTESLRNLGLFAPLVIRMLRIGETTGALDEALLNVGHFYRRSVEDWVERGLKLLEVGLTLFLAMILAFIIYAVLSPIYDILGKLSY